MSFTNPLALALLILIPLTIWLARTPTGRKRRRWRGREIASLIVRSMMLGLVVLALGGIQWVQATDNLATVFVLDVSDSVGSAGQAEGLTFIQQALGEMGTQDQAAVVVFGGEAVVERTMSDSPLLREINSVARGSYTDLAKAIGLSMSLFPNDAAKRIVILSDGAQNVGQARQAAQLASAGGAEISIVPLTRQSGVEVRLDELSAPPLLRTGEGFDLRLAIHSTNAMDVPIQIFSQGQLIAQDTVRVQAGRQSFTIPLQAGQSRFATFEARIFPPQDTFAQNNALTTFSQTDAAQQILLLRRDPTESLPLVTALQQSGLNVIEVAPSGLPSDLSGLLAYDALVLLNVPSFTLAPRQLSQIQSYVRDLGRGLLVVGGEESYGPGGYFQTPLEETLPVEMTITDQQRLPGMTILMVIDKSGSMADGGSVAGGPRKVELAKEAIYRSIDLLVPWDRIGVIAFDNQARWVVNPTPVTNVSAIKDAVGTIRASGGTDIFAGQKAAAEAMRQETTQVRHIIILSDGGATPDGIPELAQELFDEGVTTSVVAIGQGYAPFLEEVAKIGGGRFHFADDATVIPQIFAQETSLASRSYIVEETFTPKVTGLSPILDGLTRVPPLHGYVAVSSKLTAQTIMRGGEDDDPLLAKWQYGLGRSVAWMSDAKGQWAVDWVNWPEFPRFWSQAVRWTMVQGATGGLESEVRLVGDQAVVTVEALDGQGGYRNGLNLSMNVVAPNGASGNRQQQVTLQQVAPGLYEGRFRPEGEGSYFLALRGEDGGEIVAGQTRGFEVSYSPEYRDTMSPLTSSNDIPRLLTDLMEIGGGRNLAGTPEQVFSRADLSPVYSQTDLWPWLLLIAICLLPLDIALRRIIFGREELRQLWVRVRGGARPDESRADKSSYPEGIRKPVSSAPTTSSAVQASQPIEPPDEPRPDESSKPVRSALADDPDTVQRLLKVKRKRRG